MQSLIKRHIFRQNIIYLLLSRISDYPASWLSGIYRLKVNSGMRIRIFFPRIRIKKSDSDPTLIRNEKKYLYVLMKKNIYIIVTAVTQQEVSDLFKNFPELKYFVIA